MSLLRLLFLWLLVAAGCNLMVNPVKAQKTAPLDLFWEAPSSCLNKKEVTALVFSLLPPGAEPPPTVHFAGSVTRENGSYSLRLILGEGDFEEERFYAAPSCEEVVGAGSVAMALLMQAPHSANESMKGGAFSNPSPEDDWAASQQLEADDSVASNEAASAESQLTDSTSRDGETRSVRLVISAPTISVSLGLLPHAAWGLGASAGVEVRRYRFLLNGTWYLNSSISSPDHAETQARLYRARLSLLSCRWIFSGPIELAPCAVVGLEHLRVRGEGANITPQTDQTNWVAVGPGFALRSRLTGALALAAGMALEFQTARPQIVIAGQGELGRSGPLNLTANLGAEWIF